MRHVKIVIATLIAATVLTAGCLGGGDKPKEDNPDFVEGKGTTGAAGNVEQLAQASPEPVTERVDITIPLENVTEAVFTIVVDDAMGDESDEGTPPDDVSGTIEDAMDAGISETLPQGQTHYSTTVTLKAKSGGSLPSVWTVTLNVVCHASASMTPGFLIWIGTPDHGFSYDINVTYKYLKPA
jgi:hypothetical protein